MKRKYNRLMCGMLAALTLSLTACGGATTEQATSGTQAVSTQQNDTVAESTETGTEAGTEEMAEALRYQPEWTRDAVIYEVNIRQYTEEGTFQAFSEHLQELKDMGINTLWFMPIHPISERKRSGTLGSYYSITDYRDTNPEFGTREDFKALVDKAHEMGFKVMMDWVANHTGWDCAWIEEHPEWYTQDTLGTIISPEGMGWPDVADLNYDSEELRTEMIDCMKYWVEEFDVDGFRCDFASGVPVDFWETARKELEQIKPLYMLAEDDKSQDLLNSAFDLNYNLKLYDTLLAVAKDRKQADKIRIYIPKDYPQGTYTMNFLDNHDKNSYERTIYDGFGEDTLPAMFSLIYMIPGTPMIYSGNEIAYNHQIEFMEKDTIDWNSSHLSYRELLAELGSIRSSNAALHNGNYGGEINYYDLGSGSAFAFYREKDGNVVKCLFNLSKRELTVDVTEMFDETETVLLHGQGAEILEMEDYAITEDALDGEVTLQPWEFWIVTEEK